MLVLVAGQSLLPSGQAGRRAWPDPGLVRAGVSGGFRIIGVGLYCAGALLRWDSAVLGSEMSRIQHGHSEFNTDILK